MNSSRKQKGCHWHHLLRVDRERGEQLRPGDVTIEVLLGGGTAAE